MYTINYLYLDVNTLLPIKANCTSVSPTSGSYLGTITEGVPSVGFIYSSQLGDGCHPVAGVQAWSYSLVGCVIVKNSSDVMTFSAAQINLGVLTTINPADNDIFTAYYYYQETCVGKDCPNGGGKSRVYVNAFLLPANTNSGANPVNLSALPTIPIQSVMPAAAWLDHTSNQILTDSHDISPASFTNASNIQLHSLDATIADEILLVINFSSFTAINMAGNAIPLHSNDNAHYWVVYVAPPNFSVEIHLALQVQPVNTVSPGVRSFIVGSTGNGTPTSYHWKKNNINAGSGIELTTPMAHGDSVVCTVTYKYFGKTITASTQTVHCN